MDEPTEPIEKYRDMVKPNEKGRHHPETPHDQEDHVLSEEEKLDEMIDESFPASDPPGHISKSSEDKDLH